MTLTRERVRRVVAHPSLVGRGLNRLWHRRLGLRRYNDAGVDVFDEEWDNLLLLDACRYDTFRKRADLPGRLERRTSRGSSTVEFLYGNLHDQTAHDTVYVTANPQLDRFIPEFVAKFHAVRRVWEGDGWDDDVGTVLPDRMVEAVRTAASDFPDKRLFAHFVQPHYPFIGASTEADKGHLGSSDPDHPNVWNAILEGRLGDESPDEIVAAYEKNLDPALAAVESLIDDLDGLTVVTSDHGNMLGERARPIPIREWGHPRGIYTRGLVTVPWQVVEGTRRTVVSEEPTDSNRETTADVDDRLEALGYR